MRNRHSHVYLERKQSASNNARVCATTIRPTGEDGDTWQGPVIDDQTATPPGSPDRGDRYIVPCGASGAWEDYVGFIAEWVGNQWRFTEPSPGSTVWVLSRNYFTTFLQTNMVSGVTTVVDADIWFPHHFIDASHTIYPGRIVDRTNTPPLFPALYAAYIVTATATGAWAGKEDKIAVSVCDKISEARTWAFVNAQEGQLVWVDDENWYYVYDGSLNQWVPLHLYVLNRGVLNDLSNVQGTPSNNQVLTYNSGTGQWEPDDTQFVPHALNDHTDTTLDNPQTGDLIYWDGNSYDLISPDDLDVPVGDHTLGIPHSNVADAVDSAAVGSFLKVPSSSGQWAAGTILAGDLPSHTHDIADITNLQITINDLDSRLDDLEGGGGGSGATGVIVGAVYYPSPSGPWTVYTGSGFTVSDASGGTITFTSSKTSAFGVSDDGDTVIRGVGAGTTWVFGLGSPPPTVPTVFAFTAS